jgi:uncharacterized DUF497 family protein
MTFDYIFEWDLFKEFRNILKHGVSFHEAREVFRDPRVIHLKDERHSRMEERFYAVGKIQNGEVITVRYTLRGQVIRIFGAARWRKWRKFYEQNTRS